MLSIAIQIATDKDLSVKRSLLKKWAIAALQPNLECAEVTLRVVDSVEMTTLNSTYRHKSGPTNVLSFPFSMHEDIDIKTTILGDIVICAEVVNREAQEQHKSREAHWAHMVIHGIYHLLGYDHETDEDAAIMEKHEIEIMQSLGFTNPYETGDDQSYE